MWHHLLSEIKTSYDFLQEQKVIKNRLSLFVCLFVTLHQIKSSCWNGG